MKKKRLWWLLLPGVIVILGVVFLLGPRPESSPDVPVLDIGSDVTAYVAAQEAPYGDIDADKEKTIRWARSPGERTTLSLVYLHGFTGSRQEMEPAPAIVADRLGANIFYTRYAGHGRGPDPMGDATAQDWVDDTAEAIAVGRAIGDSVVVIATSTAGPLVAWLAAHDVAPDAMVLCSPNFGPADDTAELLLLPWGRLIPRVLFGKYNTFETESPMHERYTTSRFRSSALVTMMEAVNLGRIADLESISTPLLCLYSSKDDVVSLDQMRAAFDRIGSADKRLVEIKTASGHVLAGDMLSPQSTSEFVEVVVGFVEDTFGVSAQ